MKNAYLRIPIFKISRGSMPPDPLEGARAGPRRDRVAITSFGVLEFHAPPPPPNNINTAHRGRFQVNVNPIGDSKQNGARIRRSLRWACRASSSPNLSLSPWILFVSCPRLKLEELSSREAPLKATNRGQSTVSSSIFPSLNIVTTKPNLAVQALVRLLW